MWVRGRGLAIPERYATHARCGAVAGSEATGPEKPDVFLNRIILYIDLCVWGWGRHDKTHQKNQCRVRNGVPEVRLESVRIPRTPDIARL